MLVESRQRSGDTRLDRFGGRDIVALPLRCQVQEPPSRACRVCQAHDQPAGLEPLEDTGQGARVELEYLCEGSCREAWAAPKDTKDETLRARQPEDDPLRCLLQAEVEPPDEPRERENGAEGCLICVALLHELIVSADSFEYKVTASIGPGGTRSMARRAIQCLL